MLKLLPVEITTNKVTLKRLSKVLTISGGVVTLKRLSKQGLIGGGGGGGGGHQGHVLPPPPPLPLI